MDTMQEALKQVEGCDFECEAGPLKNNVGWLHLRNAVEGGPKFSMGQVVDYEVTAEVKEIKLSQKVAFTIVGIRMGSDTERRTYAYDLSNDPPDAYHYGKVSFTNIAEPLLKARSAAPARQRLTPTPKQEGV